MSLIPILNVSGSSGPTFPPLAFDTFNSNTTILGTWITKQILGYIVAKVRVLSGGVERPFHIPPSDIGIDDCLGDLPLLPRKAERLYQSKFVELRSRGLNPHLPYASLQPSLLFFSTETPIPRPFLPTQTS